jgi:hypothetical protein
MGSLACSHLLWNKLRALQRLRDNQYAECVQLILLKQCMHHSAYTAVYSITVT